MSSREEVRGGNSIYFQIIEGTFRQQVRPDHPEAVVREWSTPDGKSGTKYERVVHGLTGRIERIEFREGDYGKNLEITLEANDDGKHPVINIGTATKYGEDAVSKLPNVDFTKEVNIRPFSFHPKGDPDKTVTGLEFNQQDEEGKFTVHIENAFLRKAWDEAKKTMNREYLDPEFPRPGADSADWDSDEWKAYYAKARRYMINAVLTSVVPKLGKGAPQEAGEEVGGIQYPEEEINPEDIPF